MLYACSLQVSQLISMVVGSHGQPAMTQVGGLCVCVCVCVGKGKGYKCECCKCNAKPQHDVLACTMKYVTFAGMPELWLKIMQNECMAHRTLSAPKVSHHWVICSSNSDKVKVCKMQMSKAVKLISDMQQILIVVTYIRTAWNYNNQCYSFNNSANSLSKVVKYSSTSQATLPIWTLVVGVVHLPALMWTTDSRPSSICQLMTLIYTDVGLAY